MADFVSQTQPYVAPTQPYEPVHVASTQPYEPMHVASTQPYEETRCETNVTDDDETIPVEYDSDESTHIGPVRRDVAKKDPVEQDSDDSTRIEPQRLPVDEDDTTGESACIDPRTPARESLDDDSCSDSSGSESLVIDPTLIRSLEGKASFFNRMACGPLVEASLLDRVRERASNFNSSCSVAQRRRRLRRLGVKSLPLCWDPGLRERARRAKQLLAEAVELLDPRFDERQ